MVLLSCGLHRRALTFQFETHTHLSLKFVYCTKVIALTGDTIQKAERVVFLANGEKYFCLLQPLITH